MDLFDRACPITAVITIEALKEGWDCSFAYVFCSVAKVRSSTDVEQLLGRVLRMPYAKRRKAESLNRAYAQVSTAEFYQAANGLRDCLVSMGFEELEAEVFLQQASPLFNPDEFAGKTSRPGLAPLELTVQAAPDLSSLNATERERVVLSPTENGVKVTITGETTEAMVDAILSGADVKSRATVQLSLQRHRAMQSAWASPSMSGAAFVPLPRLSAWVQGELVLADSESFVTAGQQDLLDLPFDIRPEDLRTSETSQTYRMDLEDNQLSLEYADGNLNLDRVDLGWTEADLVFWLLHQTRDTQLPAAMQMEFIRRHLAKLQEDKNTGVPLMVRYRHQLGRLIARRIKGFLEGTRARGFQALLFGEEARPMADFERCFQFDPGNYPAPSLYKGAFKFKKHYYPVPGVLESQGEEFLCAQALERCPEVRHWVRNLSGQPLHSFWLPTSTDRFYPDFVAELLDGRTLVVEYKGEPYKTNDDSKEKALVGGLWERLSSGKGLFLMAVAEDEGKRGMAEQIQRKLAAPRA